MNLVCFNIQIRRDKEGRYCLNDLHKAAILSGANERTKEPGKFMASPQTIELVGEMTVTQNTIAPYVSVKGGKDQGTYVCKELLYAYAMWLDKLIFLKIVKAVDDLAIIQEALNNFEVPEDVPDMYVYAIKNKDTGNIKLGISKNPEQRLKQLQIGCDGKLELVAYRKADNGYRDELQLHAENEQHAIHGEWFTSDAKFN